MSTLKGYPVLRWTNRNQKQIEGTNIYRSVGTPLDPNALPAPYDFLSGSQEYYADSGTSNYNTYYYMIGVVKGDEEKISSGMIEITLGQELMKPVNITSEYYKNDIDDVINGPINLTGNHQTKTYDIE